MEKSAKRLPMYDPDLPTEFEAYLFSKNTLTRIGFMFCQVLLYAFRPMICWPRTFVIDDVIGAICQVLYIGSAVHFTNLGALVYLFSATIMGQGMHVASVHFIAEHYCITEELSYINDATKAQDTFSYYGPLNPFMYNGGYHIEHHDFPKIPYRNLPVLKKIASEYYDTLQYHTSYFKVLV
jgi:sphingolipid delta-4 desaturase